MKNLNELSKDIHKANVEKGFYEQEKNIGEMLALIHSEVSEALEAHRKDNFSHVLQSEKGTNLDTIVQATNTEFFNTAFNMVVKDTFEDEIADSIIRLLDLCGYLEIDIEKHIEAKLRFNSLRAHKHGKKY